MNQAIIDAYRHKQINLDEEQLRRSARTDLLSMIQYCFQPKGEYITNWHHVMICDALMRWMKGEESYRYLIINMPPQHGKTEIVSRNLTAFSLARDGDKRFVIGTYGQDLAQSIGGDVRRLVASPEYLTLFPHMVPGSRDGIRAKLTDQHIQFIGQKGDLRLVGRGQAITGFRVDRLGVDDPLSGALEAISQAAHIECQLWWNGNLMTRLSSKAPWFLNLTRWCKDDLAQFIIDRYGLIQNGGLVRLLIFPAICVEEREGDPRKIGEALFPAMHPIEDLLQKKRIMDPYEWEAIYQQNPIERTGANIDRNWFRYYDEEIPDGSFVTIWIDPAFSKEGAADDAVIVTAARCPKGYYYIMSCQSGRWGLGDMCHMAIQRSQVLKDRYGDRFHGMHIEQWVHVEDIMKRIMLENNCLVPIFPVKPVKGEGPDIHVLGRPKRRIRRLGPYYQEGYVFHHRNLRGSKMEDQIVSPGGAHDDCADAVAQFVLHSDKPIVREKPQDPRTMGPAELIQLENKKLIKEAMRGQRR